MILIYCQQKHPQYTVLSLHIPPPPPAPHPPILSTYTLITFRQLAPFTLLVYRGITSLYIRHKQTSGLSSFTIKFPVVSLSVPILTTMFPVPMLTVLYMFGLLDCHKGRRQNSLAADLIFSSQLRPSYMYRQTFTYLLNAAVFGL